MEGIITSPFSGQEYIQYGNLTFKNETNKIYRVDPSTVDMDQFVQVDTSLKSQTNRPCVHYGHGRPSKPADGLSPL